MTPDSDMLAVRVLERDAPWEAPGEVAERVIDAMLASPFGPFQRMEYNLNDKWVDLNPASAAKRLARGKKAMLQFCPAGQDDYFISVSRNPLQNAIVMHVPESLLGPSFVEEAEGFVDTLISALPKPSWADCDLHHVRRKLAEELDLPPVPPCFSELLCWYHVVTARGYAPYFGAEDFGGVPAFEHELSGDGTLRMKLCESPYDLANPETRNRIAEVTRHLNARRQDWKRMRVSTQPDES